MILIKNSQRKIKLDTEQLKHDAQTVLDALDYSDFDLGIWLASDAMIRKYNHEYRNKDKATDVLSFPYHATLKAGERIKVKTEEDKNLGDIIIAPHYVQKDLPRWEQTFEQRLKVLLVHGVCHLLGYDHIEDADYKIMHKKEVALLRTLK
ncbi:MAG: rRNA maturation RNase YbeY [Candidatus Dependentiae bacterium]|nr:rRNA maturation RNase YbeY [Candidatus Dependentiae bacterium]